MAHRGAMRNSSSLRPVSRGDPVTADLLNKLVDQVLRRISVDNGRASRIGRNLMLAVEGTGAGGGGPQIKVGRIETCDYSAGTVTVRFGTGELGSLTIDEETTPVVAYQGSEAWHEVGEEVVLFKTPHGVTPGWIVDQRISGARHWEPPDVEQLSATQDSPPEVTSCGGE